MNGRVIEANWGERMVALGNKRHLVTVTLLCMLATPALASEVASAPPAAVQAVRKQAFGFTLPSLNLFEHGAKPEEINEVVLTVESARQNPDGKWVLELEGGQIWRQIDTGEFSRDPKPGAKATIKKAMLGSYMMMIGGHSPVRVHRDQ